MALRAWPECILQITLETTDVMSKPENFIVRQKAEVWYETDSGGDSQKQLD